MSDVGETTARKRVREVEGVREVVSGGAVKEQLARKMRSIPRAELHQMFQEMGLDQVRIPDGHLLATKVDIGLNWNQCRKLRRVQLPRETLQNYALALEVLLKRADRWRGQPQCCSMAERRLKSKMGITTSQGDARSEQEQIAKTWNNNLAFPLRSHSQSGVGKGPVAMPMPTLQQHHQTLGPRQNKNVPAPNPDAAIPAHMNAPVPPGGRPTRLAAAHANMAIRAMRGRRTMRRQRSTRRRWRSRGSGERRTGLSTSWGCSVSPHMNHGPEDEDVEARRITCRMLATVEADPSQPARRVVHDEDDIGNVPNFQTVRTQLERRRAALAPPIPYDVADVVIPDQWRETWDGREYVSHQDNEWGIVVFATNRNYRKMRHCSVLYMDGTFRSCPRPYQQFLTIHGLCHGRVIPLVMTIMADKRVGTYRQVLNHVKRKVREQTGRRLRPERIVSDFEAALMAAYETEFVEATTSGCYFHFCQSLWRHIQQLGPR
ncbi:hypothetical protein Bbelb_318700 [Branchiostoma belcheri]|nr:hypothetical protein Bbelb_318700 [Branchiostoma belcheri]